MKVNALRQCFCRYTLETCRVSLCVIVLLAVSVMAANCKARTWEELEFEITSEPSGASVFVNYEEDIMYTAGKVTVNDLEFQKIGVTPLTWKLRTEVGAYVIATESGEYGQLPLRFFAFRVAKSGYLEREGIFAVYSIRSTSEPGNVYYLMDEVVQSEEQVKRRKRFLLFTNTRMKAIGRKPKPIRLHLELEEALSEVDGFRVGDYGLKDHNEMHVKPGDKVDLLVELGNSNPQGWFAYEVGPNKSFVTGFDAGFPIYDALAVLEVQDQKGTYPEHIGLLQAECKLGYTFFPGESKTARFSIQFSKDIPKDFSAVFILRVFGKTEDEKDAPLIQVPIANATITIDVSK